MLSKRFGLALLAAMTLVAGVAAQELKQVSLEEATLHLAKQTEPEYPALAAQAHIQGDVIVRLTVDETGRVTDAKVVSGHPLLLGSALKTAREWEFNPFLENGKPVSVSAQVKVSFFLGPGAELRSDYLHQEGECINQIQSNRFVEADKVCKKALAVAVKLPKSFDPDKMRAYGNAGTVAYGLKKPAEALEDFKQELGFAEQTLQPGNAEMIEVRCNLAHAYVATGQLQAADAAYSEAEKAVDAAAQELEKRRDKMKPHGYQGVKASYDHNLQIILQEHVVVLRKLGKASEAQALDARANSIAASRKQQVQE